MKPDHFKLPRLYVDQNSDRSMGEGTQVDISAEHAHYLKNVMRRTAGDECRVFNGRDGEYLVRIDALGKKSGQGTALEQIRSQPKSARAVHLIFSPIQKNRMDILIEKAVELGVTDFHPVLMDRTQGKKINEDRLRSQIFEAAEQCERLEIPRLHDLRDMRRVVGDWAAPAPIQWCFERDDGHVTHSFAGDHIAFLIGPAGGFSDTEIAFLSGQKNIETVSLGEAVYRVETAALVCLARVR